MINAFGYHLIPTGLALDQVLREVGATVIPAGVGNADLQVKMMLDLGVTGYIGTPSWLMALIPKAEERGLDFRWLSTPDESEAIKQMVAADNLRLWNGTTRRAAIAWFRDANTDTEQPVGVAWIALDTFEETQLGLSLRLNPEQAWLHSGYVTPGWRKRGVYQALLRFILNSLQEQNADQMLLGVSIGNEASRKSHESVGAKPIGRKPESCLDHPLFWIGCSQPIYFPIKKSGS